MGETKRIRHQNINKPSHQSKPNATNNSDNMALVTDYLQRKNKNVNPDNVLTLQRTLGNKFVNNMLDSGDSATSKRRATTRKVQRVTANQKIQRLAYDDPPPWGTVTVKRSGEGQAGVFFIKQGEDKVVLKPLDDVGNVEFANDFMEEGMGFEAPQVKSYEKSSTEGQALEELLIANKDKGRDEDEVENQVNAANYFMVMSLVEGKSIQTLDDDEAAAFITDQQAMKDVGKMMAADSWLGNTDRLVGGNVNLGNFFYAAAGTINARVTTIDNDSKFVKGAFNARGNLTGDLDNKLSWMEMLMDGTNRMGVIGMFLSKFKQVHKNNPNTLAALDEQFVKDNVSIGIDEGFQQMANVFSTNMDLVRKLRGYTDNGNRNYSSAKAMSEYVKEREGGTSKEDAVEKLKSYVTYRAKQDKTIKGFKWASNLITKRGF